MARTPADTDLTDPTSPTGSEPATRGRALRTRNTTRRRRVRERGRGVGRVRRRRSGGRPAAMPVPAEAAEQHLIEPDRRRRADPVRVIDQRRAVTVHGVHHRVPVTPKIIGNLRDRTAMATDLDRRPPASPIGDRRCSIRDPRVGLGERHHRAHGVRASAALLVPHEPCPPSEARQITELDLIDVMAKHHATAPGAHRPLGPRRDCDSQVVGPVADTDHVHIGRPTSSSHMRLVLVSNRGSSSSGCVRHTQIRRAPARARGPRYTLSPRSDPKRHSSTNIVWCTERSSTRVNEWLMLRTPPITGSSPEWSRPPSVRSGRCGAGP